MTVAYAVETGLDPAEFVDVFERSGLAERRPVHDQARVGAMVRNANLIVCARAENGQLVGVSRAITDFAFCCYLSDLAVDRVWQGRGIGAELIRRTHEAAGGESVTLILVAAPAARDYYPKVGLTSFPGCFGRLRVDSPGG